jgi:RimJ/RimL family protein N-acetyltransferase
LISLRAATHGDAELLRAWRNDPVTRSSAFTASEVTSEEHGEWLARKLANPDCAIWIAQVDDHPVGQVRLDRAGSGDVAEVDIAVAPGFRGRGYAAAMLRLVTEEAPRRLPIRRLLARVKPGNEASALSFRRAGFTELSPAEDGVLRFELPLASPQKHPGAEPR